MRRGIVCTLLLAVAAASTPSTATPISHTKSQGRLPTLTARFPRGFGNGFIPHLNTSVNIDGRQPSYQNHPCYERRARVKSRSRRTGLVQSCFLQPCSSAPVVRERAGRRAGLSSCEQPERSAMRFRHRAKQPSARRWR